MAVHVKKGPVKKDGCQSLFLLTYNKFHDQHKPLRESLNTYIYATPKTVQQKEHNRQRMMYAEKVRIQREAEFDAGGGGASAFLNQGSFVEYFKRLMEEKRDVEGNYSTWKSTYNHLVIFLKGNDIKFKDCDDIFLNHFKGYLSKCKSIKSIDTNLSKNSANIYLSKIKAALNQAVKDRIIMDNPGDRLTNIKMEETSREYLTIEEVRKLWQAKCKIPLLKKAFLFSCMTGLRWSDVYKLKWDEIVYSEQEDRWKIHYKQKKTKNNQYLPIKDEVIKLLGIRGNQDEKVFKGLKYSAYHNQVLAEWVKGQGINKHITFHCARHTFATISLIGSTDVYVLSKFLGHKDIKTTMIYAKIVNTTMNEAVDLFPTIGV